MRKETINLEDEVGLRNALIANKTIKEFVGFKNGFNVVTVEFGHKVYYADMRIRGNNMGVEFAIFAQGRHYKEETSPFKCIGWYDKATKKLNIAQMDFALGSGYSATIGCLSDPSKNEIVTKTYMGKFIPEKERQRIFKEYIEAVKSGEDEVMEFFSKYNGRYDMFPATLSQHFTFDKNPVAGIKNFADGYHIAGLMFLYNSQFGINIGGHPFYGSIVTTKNGVYAMKEIGARSVNAECRVDISNFCCPEFNPMKVYSSSYKFALDKKAGTDYSVGYLENLDVSVPEEEKERLLHYDLSSPYPKMFNVNDDGHITGLAKISRADEKNNTEDVHELISQLNEAANIMYYDDPSMGD